MTNHDLDTAMPLTLLLIYLASTFVCVPMLDRRSATDWALAFLPVVNTLVVCTLIVAALLPDSTSRKP
jgi:hypothetical protein